MTHLRTQFLFSNFFFFVSLAVYEKMWKNVAQPDRPQATVWPLRISRCVPNATDTQSLYMQYLFFQQWLYERASMLLYPYFVSLV